MVNMKSQDIGFYLDSKERTLGFEVSNKSICWSSQSDLPVYPFYPLVGWLLTLSWFYWFYFVDFLMDHSLLAASQLQFTQTSSMPILLLIPQMANWDFYKVSYQLLTQPAPWFSEVNGLDRQTDGQTEEWLYLSWIKLTLL